MYPKHIHCISPWLDAVTVWLSTQVPPGVTWATLLSLQRTHAQHWGILKQSNDKNAENVSRKESSKECLTQAMEEWEDLWPSVKCTYEHHSTFNLFQRVAVHLWLQHHLPVLIPYVSFSTSQWCQVRLGRLRVSYIHTRIQTPNNESPFQVFTTDDVIKRNVEKDESSLPISVASMPKSLTPVMR